MKNQMKATTKDTMKVKMKKIISPARPGFTFVELLFAIVVMGTMFALALVVFVGMLRFYVFAGSVRTNQENARNVLDTISRDVRFGQLIEPSAAVSTGNTLCVYKKADRTVVKYELDTDIKVLNKYTSANQDSAPPDCDITFDTAQSVFNARATAAAFEVIKVAGSKPTVYSGVSSVTIKLQLITGTPADDGVTCASNNIYCNSLTLNTAVNIRGSQ